MYRVEKRNGKLIDFDIQKIVNAIKMAFEATEKQYNNSMIDFLALKVTADFEPKIKDGKIKVDLPKNHTIEKEGWGSYELQI